MDLQGRNFVQGSCSAAFNKSQNPLAAVDRPVDVPGGRADHGCERPGPQREAAGAPRRGPGRLLGRAFVDRPHGFHVGLPGIPAPVVYQG